MTVYNALGHRDAPLVTTDARNPPDTDRPSLGAIDRRLRRLTPNDARRVRLDGDRYVFDLGLQQSRVGSMLSSREDFQRHGGGGVSSLFVRETDGGCVVDEYCFRLPEPSTSFAWPELVREMQALAIAAQPPAGGVRVYLRPPRRLFGLPDTDTVLDDATPHFAAWDRESHPSMVLDFLSELLRIHRSEYE